MREDLESVVKGKNLNHGPDICEFRETMETKENNKDICQECKGKYGINTKNVKICPYSFNGGINQGKPISFKNGKVYYECQRLTRIYSLFGAGV